MILSFSRKDAECAPCLTLIRLKKTRNCKVLTMPQIRLSDWFKSRFRMKFRLSKDIIALSTVSTVPSNFCAKSKSIYLGKSSVRMWLSLTFVSRFASMKTPSSIKTSILSNAMGSTDMRSAFENINWKSICRFVRLTILTSSSVTIWPNTCVETTKLN